MEEKWIVSDEGVEIEAARMRFVLCRSCAEEMPITVENWVAKDLRMTVPAVAQACAAILNAGRSRHEVALLLSGDPSPLEGVDLDDLVGIDAGDGRRVLGTRLEALRSGDGEGDGEADTARISEHAVTEKRFFRGDDNGLTAAAAELFRDTAAFGHPILGRSTPPSGPPRETSMDEAVARALEVLHARRHEPPSEDLARAVLEAALSG